MKAVFLDYMSLAAEDLDMSGLQALPIEFAYHLHTDASQTLERIAGFDVVLSNKVVIGAEHFAKNPQLKKVVILATGTNNVDLEAARGQGVSVSNIVDYSTQSVVQQVFAMLLALKCSLLPYHNAVQRGDWHKSPFFGLLDYPIDEIAGQTLGIIGYGKIGQAVAGVARAFGMQVLVCQSLQGEVSSGRVSLSDLLQHSDVVSLHCPLTPESSNLIGETELALMKPGAVLLNLARGGIVNEQALMSALQQGHLAGAAVDVLSEEPPVDGQPLLQAGLPNLLLTPHTGWASRQARQNLVGQVGSILQAHLAGKPFNSVL